MANTPETVDSILKPFQLTLEDYKKIKQVIYNDLEKGLRKETNATGNLRMNPTHVRDIPDGTEKGKFLALDLGGSNFRILCFTLEPGQPVQKISKSYKLRKELLSGTGDELFGYIADSLIAFLEENGIAGERLPLGFTFSYPCEHTTLKKAILQYWTKDFNVSGVAGKDVSELLCQALKERGNCNLDLLAIINDTTGVLVSCAYEHHDCKIGLIVGTGCNCCYMEKLENVELWNGDMDEPRQVMIDIEWGALGDDGTLDAWRTPIDFQTDSHTINSGHQKYEKMITGNYIGETVRLIMVKLAENNLLFGGKVTEQLNTEWAFETKHISEIESETNGNYDVCKKVMKQYGLEASVEDCKTVLKVCEVAMTRAAWLCATGISAVAAKVGEDQVTVGVDGSIYINHPKFHDHMTSAIKVLSDVKVKFVLSEDGSGRGGALVAAIASKLVA